jgi:lactate permease
MGQDELLYMILSFVPLVLLIVLSLLISIRIAAFISFLVTAILFFFWGADLIQFGATLVTTAFSTLNILLVVFGAIFLYGSMKSSGYVARINESIGGLSPHRDLRFFLLVIGLTAFFEGVAGFGTPGAIVPLLLISMGYAPLLSVTTVLLADGIFAVLGAVGTPLIAGLKLPLSLSDADTTSTAFLAVSWLMPAALVVAFFTWRYYKKQENEEVHVIRMIFLWLFALVPLLIFAYLIPEYATVLAAAFMLMISVVFLRDRSKPFRLGPWVPYLVLVLLLLLPKMIPFLNTWLDEEVGWEMIFGTELNAWIKPLKSPVVPFVLVAMIFGGNKKNLMAGLKAATLKMGSVALLLFPVIGVAQLMLHSGGVQDSMIEWIAASFSRTGDIYIFLSPFIGMIGSFVTGSTTVSNIVFGPSQLATAELLDMSVPLVLSLQLAGASIGNAICLFNIIAACSVAGISDTNKVLLKNLWPCLLAVSLMAVAGFVFI